MNLLKNIIYDNVDNLILNLDLIQALDNKKFNSLVDQWCNTKKIITNIDINYIPTIELKDALLSKLKIILESIISYTNKINEILDLFDYIISNSLKKKPLFI